MTIECLEFKKGGCFIDPEKRGVPSQIQDALEDHGAYTIGTLTPGFYDLTPRQWRDHNFKYWVNVKTDGMGTLRMVPRVEGAASRFVEEKEWTPGAREYPLGPGSDPVIIVGGSDESPSGLAVYKLVYWRP